MKKTKQGIIISDKMAETAVVRITRLKEHFLYKKKYKTSKNYKVHNPNGKFKTGEIVEIEETKPFSKEKHWKIMKSISN